MGKIPSVLVLDTSKLQRNIQKVILDWQKVSEASLHEVGIEIIARAMELTPLLTGHLRRSYDKDVYWGAHGWNLTVKNTAKYAPYVHELVNNFHPIGQAKFLEQALKEKEKMIIDILVEGMKK